jgi:uncharacterized protein involved in type VI secretion and phage assembly
MSLSMKNHSEIQILQGSIFQCLSKETLLFFYCNIQLNKIDILSGLIGQKITLLLFNENSPSIEFDCYILSIKEKDSFITDNIDYSNFQLECISPVGLLNQNITQRTFYNKTSLDVISKVFIDNNIKFSLMVPIKNIREIFLQYNQTDLSFIKEIISEEGMFFFEKNNTLLIGNDITSYNIYNVTDENSFYIKKNLHLCNNSSNITGFNYNSPQTIFHESIVNNENHIGVMYYNGININSIYQLQTQLSYKSNDINQQKTSFTFQSSLKTINVCDVIIYKNNSYFISEVEHNIENGQYNNKFKCFPFISSPFFNSNINDINNNINYTPLFRGIVVNNILDDKNRIPIRFLWDSENNIQYCRLSFPYAGNEEGIICIPKKDHEVVVIFDKNINDFIIIGSCYNGQNKIPESNNNIIGFIQNDKNNSSFNKILMDITPQNEKISINTSGDISLNINNNINIEGGDLEISVKSVTIKTQNAKIESSSVEIGGDGSKISITSSGVSITSTSISLSCASIQSKGVLQHTGSLEVTGVLTTNSQPVLFA